MPLIPETKQHENNSEADHSEITSIIDTLENGSYPRFTSTAQTLEDIIQKIDDFTLWLNTSAQSALLTSPEVNKCGWSIANLESAVAHLHRQHKRKLHVQTETSYVCRKCGFEITAQPNENLWNTFQTHEHFEEELVQFLENGFGCNEVAQEVVENEVVVVTTENESRVELSMYTTSVDVNGMVDEADVTEISSGVVDEPLDLDFKFNFIPQYDKDVQEAIYISPIVEKVADIDKVYDFTVQYRSMEKYYCLLCLCPLSPGLQSIRTHALGYKHLKFAKDTETLNSLHMYHNNFMKLDPVYQSHQVYFDPESITRTFCHLCNAKIFYVNLKEHLQQDRHMKRIFSLLNTYPMQVHSFLLPRQLQLYSTNVSGETITGTSSEHVIYTVTSKQAVNVPKKNKGNVPKEPHQVIQSVPDTVGDTTLAFLENRFLDHVKFLEETLTDVVCTLCGVSLGKDVLAVRAHVISEPHRQKCKLPFRKYMHYCGVCEFKTKVEASWAAHFKQMLHKNKLGYLPISRKMTLGEHECLTCNTILYGDEVVVKDHIANNGRIKKVKEIKLPHEMVYLFLSEDSINIESAKLISEANAVIASQNAVWACCHSLEEFLSNCYPKCKAYPFGSRVTGLGNKLSDLDVFVDIGDMYTGHSHQDAVAQENIVKHVTKLLRKDQSGSFTDVFPIPKARTPIVQVFHKPTNLDCDLSFRHGLSVENTKFLKVCMGLQPALQSLILLVKKWSKACKFDEHISTYALSIMAIFFMQVNDYLLSVKVLRKFNPQPSVIIDGWDTINYKASLDALKQHIGKEKAPPLKQLLIYFFKYYSSFKYESDVICPLMGHTVPKNDFRGCEIDQNLPPEMQSYIIKVMRTPDTEHFRSFSMMCIQDPFDLSHNLTKACQPSVVEKFKVMCELSWKALESDNNKK